MGKSVNKSNTEKVSIVILDFMKSKRVVENIENIQNQVCNFDIEIIIIDNSCNVQNREKLETLKKYDNVKLIFNETNLGYTKANNKAAKHATGKYIFIVNPDIIIKDDHALQKMVDYMDQNPKIAILGPKQVNDPEGEVAMTVRAFPKLHIQVARRTFLKNFPYFKSRVAYDEMQHLDYEITQEVDWIQSSFICVRRDFWEKVSGLHEEYFLFMSDPHICFQAWELGHRVVYYPEVHVHADGIRCSSGGVLTFFKKWTLRQHLKDSLKYQFKHFGKGNPRLKFKKLVEKTNKNLPSKN